MKVLVQLAHPAIERSRANTRVLEALTGQPNLTLRDLYNLYPRFYIDVELEKELLLAHELLVLQFPFYWYSIPPLLKLWQDEVWHYGFAYGAGGNKLNGKGLLVSLTTGGPQETYQAGGRNRYSVEDFLRPLEQSARLCGMRWLPPQVHFGVYQSQDRELDHYAEVVKDRVLTLAEAKSMADIEQ
jgi:glutathione-regulated potassium-efflux system ancillary protein KefG